MRCYFLSNYHPGATSICRVLSGVPIVENTANPNPSALHFYAVQGDGYKCTWLKAPSKAGAVNYIKVAGLYVKYGHVIIC